MSLKYLGERIDIHGGGEDLIFPHHENEIAQTEAFTGADAVRALLAAQRLGEDGRREDVEVARQLHHHPRRAEQGRRRRPAAVGADLALPQAADVQRRHAGGREDRRRPPAHGRAHAERSPATAASTSAPSASASPRRWTTTSTRRRRWPCSSTSRRRSTAPATRAKASPMRRRCCSRLAGVLGLRLEEGGGVDRSCAVHRPAGADPHRAARRKAVRSSPTASATASRASASRSKTARKAPPGSRTRRIPRRDNLRRHAHRACLRRFLNTPSLTDSRFCADPLRRRPPMPATYWDKFTTRRVSRRRLLQTAGVAGATGAAIWVVGCGGGTSIRSRRPACRRSRAD